jgi:putative endonuclease
MFNWLKQKPKKGKTLGQKGEEFAQAEYKRRGYTILAANFFNRKGKQSGEIDFIARNKLAIVFVEVKTRSGHNALRQGMEAVDGFKQRKILLAVKHFLVSHKEFLGLQPQIDVCVVLAGDVDNEPKSVIIIPNAVEDCG